MSWVFLTDTNVWKLKKPVRTHYLDFSSEALRRADCEAELGLNRRLADGVYEAVVPLALDAQGRLRLGADGHIVDWLIRMRRLPADRMLDHLLREHALKAGELELAIEHLASFYRDAPRSPMPRTRYRMRFAEEITGSRCELATPAFELPLESIEATCEHQLSLLSRRADLFDARLDRIVEGHGDLRPEHICLEDPPKIIDCLEFSGELRLLDPADELSFLALECERLGWPELASTIFGTYTAVTGDAPPPVLLDFYASFRACVRARIAIRHLADAAPREPARWSAQARAYLALASTHIGRCAAPS